MQKGAGAADSAQNRSFSVLHALFFVFYNLSEFSTEGSDTPRQ